LGDNKSEWDDGFVGLDRKTTDSSDSNSGGFVTYPITSDSALRGLSPVDGFAGHREHHDAHNALSGLSERGQTTTG